MHGPKSKLMTAFKRIFFFFAAPEIERATFKQKPDSRKCKKHGRDEGSGIFRLHA